MPHHILFLARVLFPLLLPQNAVNALSDLLGFFYLVFEGNVPLIKVAPLGGQLGIFRFSSLCRQGGLAIHYAFKVVFRRRKEDFFGFGSRLFALVF